MAPIGRFSAAEKGKAPLNEPELLPLKKRRSHCHEMVVRLVVSRPWYERLPPRYPLPFYAHANDSGGRNGERRRLRQGRDCRATEAHAVAPGIHAVGSPREFVLWAAMPPSTWICLPQFFAAEGPSQTLATTRRLRRPSDWSGDWNHCLREDIHDPRLG